MDKDNKKERKIYCMKLIIVQHNQYIEYICCSTLYGVSSSHKLLNTYAFHNLTIIH